VDFLQDGSVDFGEFGTWFRLYDVRCVFQVRGTPTTV
jgi:hypothetical protein